MTAWLLAIYRLLGGRAVGLPAPGLHPLQAAEHRPRRRSARVRTVHGRARLERGARLHVRALALLIPLRPFPQGGGFGRISQREYDLLLHNIIVCCTINSAQAELPDSRA
jgi:hypothetical protein